MGKNQFAQAKAARYAGGADGDGEGQEYRAFSDGMVGLSSEAEPESCRDSMLRMNAPQISAYLLPLPAAAAQTDVTYHTPAWHAARIEALMVRS